MSEIEKEGDDASNVSGNSPTPSTTQDLTNQILGFLSDASNETLGACLLGLCAITYFVLGRIGLVLIGAVGGVALHATWENKNAPATSDSIRRRELGLDVVQRVLDLRESKDAATEDNENQWNLKVTTRKELDFRDFQPATGAALSSLVDAVIRDYVDWWYKPILPSETSFPSACRQMLSSFLYKVSSHLSKKRPADSFLNFITNATSIFVVFLDELSSALMVPGLSDFSTAEAIHLYLEANPDSNLANVVNIDQQQRKLTAVAEDILHTFLDTKAYDCDPVKAFLREILSSLILESTIRSCSKPEWINGWIVYLLEEGEPEIMNAIDAGVGSAPVQEIKNAAAQRTLNNDSLNRSSLLESPSEKKRADANHKRKVSRAEEAMEEAMSEAKRLSELIASEDAKRERRSEDTTSSGNTTGANATPTSSQSDLLAIGHKTHQPEEVGSATSADHDSKAVATGGSNFTTFDQILAADPSLPKPLTLHNARVSIFDDALPDDKSLLRSKPNIDYLIQIEPASAQHTGWMIARKYADFETLHEVLRRISVISGVPEFTHKYTAIPGWKNKTKPVFRTDLETYLRVSLSHDRLAESEGMKRFLEKDQGRASSATNKGPLGFPTPAAFETMGKGMLDILTSAPKGAAGGGKALLDGVSGVFAGQKKATSPGRPSLSSRSGSVSSVNRPQIEEISTSGNSSTKHSHLSQDVLQSSSHISREKMNVPPLPKRPEVVESEMSREDTLPGRSPNESKQEPVKEATLNLPPLPSEISDDYSSLAESPRTSETFNDITVYHSSNTTASQIAQSPSRYPMHSTLLKSSNTGDADTPKVIRPNREPPHPLTEQETRVAVELFFAVINSLYTLSSAWNIRKTLLNAAKTFLLRPGNPSLEAIRILIQDTVIGANTSDAGIASHLLKLRENSLPTEKELKTWPAEMSDEEKERLRKKARKLLVEKGMPQALTSVMGAYASGEALGRVFDALQVENVGRGLIFAVLLQGVRGVTH